MLCGRRLGKSEDKQQNAETAIVERIAERAEADARPRLTRHEVAKQLRGAPAVGEASGSPGAGLVVGGGVLL